jgi:hypothetical protein
MPSPTYLSIVCSVMSIVLGLMALMISVYYTR